MLTTFYAWNREGTNVGPLALEHLLLVVVLANQIGFDLVKGKNRTAKIYALMLKLYCKAHNHTSRGLLSRCNHCGRVEIAETFNPETAYEELKRVRESIQNHEVSFGVMVSCAGVSCLFLPSGQNQARTWPNPVGRESRR